MARTMIFETIVQQVDNEAIIRESLIKEIKVMPPKSIMDIGFRQFRECLFMQIIDKKHVNSPSLPKKFIFGKVDKLKDVNNRGVEDYS